jgi:hypothetical protein
MFVTVTLLSSDRTIGQRVIQTALLVVIFIPFSYFLDGVFWRSYKKRLARQEQSGRGRGS